MEKKENGHRNDDKDRDVPRFNECHNLKRVVGNRAKVRMGSDQHPARNAEGNGECTMKIAERTVDELEEYIDDLEFRLLAGYDERNEIELANAELQRKRGLTE